MKKLFGLLLVCLFPMVAQAATQVIATKNLQNTPTITTSAYSDGDVIGGEQSFANAVRNFNRSGVILTATIADEDDQGADIDVYIFKTDPAGTYTDNAAFDPTDADLLEIVCVIPVTTHKSFTDNGISVNTTANCAVDLAPDQTLYAVMVASGSTPTYTATDALTLTLGMLQD